MFPVDAPPPSLRKLFACWCTFTAYLLRALAARVDALAGQGAEAVKAVMLDLDWEGADRRRTDSAEPPPLPALAPEEFVAAFRPRLKQALRRAAEVINEDPNGCWTAVTEERVAELFRDLGRAALEQALALRVAAAEGRSPPGTPHTWVTKYHRMLAAEGRWPQGPGPYRSPPLQG